MRHAVATFSSALFVVLAGCTEIAGAGCDDPTVTVSPWEGTPGTGVQWDDLSGSFRTVEQLLDAAVEGGGNATGTVPAAEYSRFQAALDSAWQETGRPGTRPQPGSVDVVEYQAIEWGLFDGQECE